MKKHFCLITIVLILVTNLSYSQYTELLYNEWEHNCSFKPKGNEFIINSEKEFIGETNCNFSGSFFYKYTLIGIKGRSWGHFEPIVDIKVLKDTENKKYIIEVKLTGGDECRYKRTTLRPVFKNHRLPGYSKIIYTKKLIAEYSIEFKYIKAYDKSMSGNCPQKY